MGRLPPLRVCDHSAAVGRELPCLFGVSVRIVPFGFTLHGSEGLRPFWVFPLSPRAWRPMRRLRAPNIAVPGRSQ